MNNTLYNENETLLSSVSDEERDFFWGWCRLRHLDDIYIIHSLLLWVRSKRSISFEFVLRDCNKYLYMILCIHLSLKWNGYDEIHKCSFLYDLRQVYPHLSEIEHSRMEFSILRVLNWEF